MINSIENVSLENKKILVRVDLNVPIIDGIVTDKTRIVKIIPTIKYLLDKNTKIIIISHFGRPDGKAIESMSLINLVKELEILLEAKIDFIDDYINRESIEFNKSNIVLLENLRFHKEEENNDISFAKKLASFADIYVNDAFSCSHRSHASIDAITNYIPSYGGFFLIDEVKSIDNLFDDSKKPVTAIIAGSKISTKIKLISALSKKLDHIIIAGAMANNFLIHDDVYIGSSIYEQEMIPEIDNILDMLRENNCKIHLPIDAVIANNLKNPNDIKIVDIQSITNDYSIFDIGPKTVQYFANILNISKAILWNGPVGAFEYKPFNLGTSNIALNMINIRYQNNVTIIAGGGDTVSAINESGTINHFDYVSSAGGAFLEYLEKELPGIKALSS